MAVKSFFYDPAESGQAPPKAKRARGPASLDCTGCGLDKDCAHPRMEPFGGGGLSIAVVAEAPGETEDATGVPFTGKSGQLLAKHFRLAGLNLDSDCVRLNVIQCRPPGNREPTDDERTCCRSRWQSQLRAIKPDLIYAFGGTAIQEILSDAPGINTSATAMDGRVIPSSVWQAWVCCSFHPSYYLREGGRFDRRLTEAIRGGLDVLDKRGPWTDQRLDPAAFTLVEDADQAVHMLDTIGNNPGVEVAFDYEATGLNPYEPGFKLLTVSLATPACCFCVPLEHRMARWTREQLDAVKAALRRFLIGSAPKIIQNRQYEDLASRVTLGVEVNNVVTDTMVREHVLDNRADVCSQKFQCYVRYGAAWWDADKSNLNGEFLDTVARGNSLDARYLLRWKQDQDKQMTPDLERAYGLFHRCLPLFTTCKARGIRLDMAELDKLDADGKAELAVIKGAAESPILADYRQKYGKAWLSTSNKDKARLFFDVMELRPLKPTDSAAKKLGKDRFEDAWSAGRLGPEDCSTDAETVQSLLAQIAEGRPERKLIQAVADEAHLDKLAGYIANFRAMADTNGIMHPSFLLHTVGTYRTSSADPNFQNIPTRVPLLARLRRTLLPMAGHDWLLEMDFSGAEVRGYAIASKDEWLVDKVARGVDFHKRYAALLYEIEIDDVTKAKRNDGKSGFTFPVYYGSYPRGIAASNPQWKPATIERVFKQFWVDQPGVLQWQKDTEQFYWDNGYLLYMTGFRPRYGKMGFLSHNDCCNYPIQGFACHRLLSVMLAVEAEMRRREMESKIVGQIHDSIVVSCVDGEVDDVILLMQEIVRRPQWPWDDVVPWDAEFKLGRNMLEMAAV